MALEQPRKKTCLTASFCDLDDLNPPDGMEIGRAGGSACFSLSITQLPEEDLKDVFMYCDVPTRCRLRRVCRYWKHLTCRPEFSEVVITNDRCLMIANPHAKDPGQGEPAKAILISRVIHGFYNRGIWPGSSFISKFDHQRHGILGPHVRVMIYYRTHGSDYDLSLPHVIRSIAFFYTNLQQIVFWRVIFTERYWPWTSGLLDEDQPSGMPTIKSIVVVRSRVYLGSMVLPWEDKTKMGGLKTFSSLDMKTIAEDVGLDNLLLFIIAFWIHHAKMPDTTLPPKSLQLRWEKRVTMHAANTVVSGVTHASETGLVTTVTPMIS